MKKSLFTIVFIFFFLFLATQAKAEEKIAIQEHIMTSQMQVTLSDVFVGLKEYGDIVIATSPAPGRKRVLDMNYIMNIAQIYDIQLSYKPLFDRIIIERLSQKVTESDVLKLLEDKLSAHMEGQAEIIMDTSGFEFHVDSQSLSPIVIEDMNYYPSNKRFVVLLGLGLDTHNKQFYKLTGKIEERVEVYVPKRPIAKGDLISQMDLELKKVPVSKTISNAISRIEDAEGLIAKRSLRAGKMIRTQDLVPPKLVRKGENIMIIYQSGPLQLSLKAIAMQDGVKNQLIRVKNVQSRKTLFAQIVKPGKAVIKY